MSRQVMIRTTAVVTALLYLAVLATLVPGWVRSRAVTPAWSAVISPSDAASSLHALSSTLPAGWPTTFCDKTAVKSAAGSEAGFLDRPWEFLGLSTPPSDLIIAAEWVRTRFRRL